MLAHWLQCMIFSTDAQTESMCTWHRSVERVPCYAGSAASDEGLTLYLVSSPCLGRTWCSLPERSSWVRHVALRVSSKVYVKNGDTSKERICKRMEDVHVSWYLDNVGYRVHACSVHVFASRQDGVHDSGVRHPQRTGHTHSRQHRAQRTAPHDPRRVGLDDLAPFPVRVPNEQRPEVEDQPTADHHFHRRWVPFGHR